MTDTKTVKAIVTPPPHPNPPATPGAGGDAGGPSSRKRLKAAHRRHVASGHHCSLKDFARAGRATTLGLAGHATAWLKGKATKPTKKPRSVVIPAPKVKVKDK